MEQQVAALIPQVMEMNERMRQSEEAAEQARQLLEGHRTAGQMLEERTNRTEASVTGTSPVGGSRKASDGVTGPWVFRAWAGRFQHGRVQEVIRAVEARPGDEATGTELDLRHDDWASAQLKSVAADFYHALILFCKGKTLKVVLTNNEGEGFEAWRALVNNYEPTSNASVVGKLAGILRTPFDGDLLDAITTLERER